jgi:hypothetical protein
MALVDFEAKRDVWQEILDSVREIMADGGKKAKIESELFVCDLPRNCTLTPIFFI